MTGLDIYFLVFFIALFLAFVYLIVHEYSAFGERMQVWLPALFAALLSVAALGVFLRVILGVSRFHALVLLALAFATRGVHSGRVTVVDSVYLYGLLCVVAFLPIFQFLARREKRKSDDAIAGEIARWKSEQEKSTAQVLDAGFENGLFRPESDAL